MSELTASSEFHMIQHFAGEVYNAFPFQYQDTFITSF